MLWRARFFYTALFLILLFLQFAFAADRPNIILITLDSLGTDRVGFLGSKGRTTPNLDGLARQSLIFEQACAQAPTTVASHASILTGTYPQTHRVNEFAEPLPPSLPFLPDLLRAQSYRTAAFVGSIALDPRNGSAPGFDRGFVTYDAGFRRPERAQGTVERSGAQVVTRATAWLEHNSQSPFFLWLHIADPGSRSGAAPAADTAVGKFLAQLRTKKLFDGALILLVASSGKAGDNIFLYDETIHVPLLLKLPQNQNAGKRVSTKVALVNIAPTILEIAKVPVPSQMEGQSLLRVAQGNSNASRPVYSRSDFPAKAFGLSTLESWRAGKYLYIRAPEPELYDLSADPRATRNLAQTSKATMETMAAQLAAFDQRFDGAGQATRLTSSEMQKLASLGYVGLQQPTGTVNTAASGIDPKKEIATINKVMSALDALNHGTPDQAIATLQPVTGGAGKMYLAQYTMGAALVQQQKYAQAIPYLHRSIELQPDSAWAHYEMGRSLQQTEDFKTAALHLEIATGRLPKFAKAHVLLAQVYQRLNRPADAKREQEQAKIWEAGR